MSALQVAAFGLDDTNLVARYDRLFDSIDGGYIQQSTAWARAIREVGPDRPIFLLASRDGEDVAGLPLYLFQAEPGNLLTSVPQPGPLGGVLARPGLDNAAREAAFGALLTQAVELAHRHGCLALTLITDPLGDDLALYERHLAPEFVLENFTQVVPLERIFDGATITLPRYHQRGGFRYQLKRALAYGFAIRSADNTADIERWYAVHAKRAAELEAAPLPRPLIDGLLRELGPAGRAQLWLIEKDADLAGGCLLIWHRDVMDVYAVSMNSRYAAEAPNYVLTDHALRWARSLSTRWFNWQSSASRSSGVYAFKARWGSEERLYHFVTKVFCPPERLAKLGPGGIKQHYPGHFVLPFGAFADGCRGGRYRKD